MDSMENKNPSGCMINVSDKVVHIDENFKPVFFKINSVLQTYPTSLVCDGKLIYKGDYSVNTNAYINRLNELLPLYASLSCICIDIKREIIRQHVSSFITRTKLHTNLQYTTEIKHQVFKIYFYFTFSSLILS